AEDYIRRSEIFAACFRQLLTNKQLIGLLRVRLREEKKEIVYSPAGKDVETCERWDRVLLALLRDRGVEVVRAMIDGESAALEIVLTHHPLQLVDGVYLFPGREELSIELYAGASVVGR